MMNKLCSFADFAISFLNPCIILYLITHYQVSVNSKMSSLAALAGLGFVAYRFVKYVFYTKKIK